MNATARAGRRLGFALVAIAIGVGAVLGEGCGIATVYPVLDLPVRVGELDGDYLWPYGVHGGGHPEGHAGFDLFSTQERTVVASADGTITVRKESDGPGGEDVEIAVGGGLLVSIHHLTPRSGLAVGDQVKRGETIGHLTLIDGRYMIHFHVGMGVSKPCPAHFLKRSDLEALGSDADQPGTLMSLSSYNEKADEPKLCNSM
ncbi:MAG: peptidoglycan DD-metalloendopeptidase family protein [Bdellovibrionales bacterium]|nr:peptidoglycan DD-metalloendopeptidase family protein [Bdellovibrionales bacterium]